MTHYALLTFAWLLAVPMGLFLLAFLAALADCTYAYLFPAPLSASVDDSF
jgi:hypothetical protein